ncbi:MAG TPA: hypothetical protein VMW08_15100 [Acidimicrobiales bacterium]|nr:hypothetical protein [Acidimicrobiales bacterium]
MIHEHHTFALTDGVTQDDFLVADERVQQEFAPFQPGFVRRTTARSMHGGSWLVAWIWSDPASLDAASAAGSESDAVEAFRACIDTESEARASYQTREWLA